MTATSATDRAAARGGLGRVAASSSCPASRARGRNPLGVVRPADARAEKLARATGDLLLIASSVTRLLAIPIPGQAAGARALPAGFWTRGVQGSYAARFGLPRANARGRFRARFGGGTHSTMEAAAAAEMARLGGRLHRIARVISGNIRYTCPGAGATRIGRCQERCGNLFAWTCHRSRAMALCPRFWTGSTADERAVTIAHEVVHMLYNYPAHRHGTRGQRGRNAYCYEGLIVDAFSLNSPSTACPP